MGDFFSDAASGGTGNTELLGEASGGEGGLFEQADFLDITGAKAQQRAIDAQERQNRQEQELKARLAAKARNDALNIFPVADENRNLGFQAALDVFGQSAPQQLSAIQQGNVGGQQALLAGLPQIQNALLGLPTDLSGLQPQAIQFDPGFLQQQLPQFASSFGAIMDDNVGQAQQAQQAQQAEDRRQALIGALSGSVQQSIPQGSTPGRRSRTALSGDAFNELMREREFER